MDEKAMTLGGQFFCDPQQLESYFVYSYEHLDCLCFVRPAEEVLSGFPDVNDYINVIRKRFLCFGWEGDGEIGLFWLPPFVVGENDTCGVFCFHVKQKNNGTSWIGSPISLRFKTVLN